MKQHKWHKEIKAWADGAEIEYEHADGKWYKLSNPDWSIDEFQYRIKPQPKDPQYLYVYGDWDWDKHSYKLCRKQGDFGAYIGKIKLEEEE